MKTILKQKLLPTLLASATAALLISSCTGSNPSVTTEQTGTGAAAVTITVGRIGQLAKKSAIEMEHLIITISDKEEDTVVTSDTSALSGTGETTVKKKFDALTAPKEFTLTVTTLDAEEMVIHQGSIDFTTIPADTIDVALDLDAKFSMLKVSFKDIPDSVSEVLLGIDDVDTLKETFDPGDEENVTFTYDYLEADTEGVEYTVSLRARGSFYGNDTVLYAADTTIVAISGIDTNYVISLKWVGPDIPHGTAEITVTIGSVGTTGINAGFGMNSFTSPQAWVKISDSFGPSEQNYRSHIPMHSTFNTTTNKLLILEKPSADNNTFPAAYLITPNTFETLSVSGPDNRENTMIAYYPPTDSYLLFGGWKKSDSYFNDTWKCSNGSWTKLDVTAPGARANSTMFYQPNTERIYLFGGSLYQTQYNETWEWDGASWSKLSVNGPAARMWPTTVYMPSQGKTLLFGGCEDYDDQYLGDTWTWDGSEWEKVADNGPKPRALPLLVFNKITSSVFMVGGSSADSSSFSSTWEWTGNSWVKTSIDTPPIRNGVVWFDDNSQKVYLYGRTTPDQSTSRELWVLQ